MITSLAIGTGGLGRFGNNCFTIAGCIGIALRSGQSWGFPEWVTHDNAIFGSKPDNINNHLVKPLPMVDDRTFQQYGYFWGYKDIYLPEGAWSIDAHMQSEKFFKDHLWYIRDVFRFKDEPPQNDYVAIHYRAGDYTEGADGHHPRCTREYYEAAMKLFPDDFFVVFTDDLKAAINIFGPEDRDLQYHHASYIDDFKLMKRCYSFITANSSFSLFAAILGEHPDKKIVCPRQWFGKSMPPEFGTDDIYPENAIII